jgi:hypothetical protein
MEYENILDKYSKQDLIEIYHNIGCWKWDNRLGKIPDNWNDIPNFMLSDQYKLPTKFETTEPIIKYISSKVKEKEIMKYWHINYCNMTKFQHEIYWIKRCILKYFGIGFYSKKQQKMMKEILEDIAEKNKNNWVQNTYGN